MTKKYFLKMLWHKSMKISIKTNVRNVLLDVHNSNYLMNYEIEI
jgi:hypothetical protein